MVAVIVGAAARPGAVRAAAVGAVSVVAFASLVACNRGPSPAPAASSFASALASGDISGAPVSGDAIAAQADLAATVDGMRGSLPDVEVADVRTDDDDDERASAVLDVSWTLPVAAAEPWAYRTEVDLALEGEKWQVVWDRAAVEPSLGPAERLVLRTASGPRGEITGQDGRALVTARGVQRLGIDKTKIEAEAAGASARALAGLLEIDPAEYQRRVEAAGTVAFVEALTLRAEDALSYTGARFASIPGATSIDGELPLAPTRAFARQLLGTVGEATAELIDASEGRLQPGDLTGLSGLQKAYDSTLGGTPGYSVQARPADGQPGEPRTLVNRDPVAGTALATTLDYDLQMLADTVLDPVGPPSAIVAVRPSDGQILAAASGPGSEGFSTATQGRYAPGSTFKIVTALGLLRGGVQPGGGLPCTETVKAAGRSFKNYSDYPSSALGTIPLSDVIAHSCNTALIASRAAAPAPALTEAAQALGLGQQADLGVPTFLGSVPADVGETEHAASLIGQGKVEASPLSMAVVAASASAGRTVTPSLLPAAAPAPAEDRLADQEADALRQLLRGVVDRGSARFLADVPGPSIGAKTGTAEYGQESPPRTHAWMIAVQGDLAVAVFVEDGASGSRTAGPLLEQFLRGAYQS